MNSKLIHKQLNYLLKNDIEYNNCIVIYNNVCLSKGIGTSLENQAEKKKKKKKPFLNIKLYFPHPTTVPLLLAGTIQSPGSLAGFRASRFQEFTWPRERDVPI